MMDSVGRYLDTIENLVTEIRIAKGCLIEARKINEEIREELTNLRDAAVLGDQAAMKLKRDLGAARAHLKAATKAKNQEAVRLQKRLESRQIKADNEASALADGLAKLEKENAELKVMVNKEAAARKKAGNDANNYRTQLDETAATLARVKAEKKQLAGDLKKLRPGDVGNPILIPADLEKEVKP